MKTIATLGLLSLLAACGGSAPADPDDDPDDPASTPVLVKPIAEPLRMRNVINRQLDVQRAEARHREELFDETVGSPR